MPFVALELSYDLVRLLREPVARIARRDPSLADQLRRAASSVSLNLAEGRSRGGRDRAHHWRIASGSAQEVFAALELAEAWGHVEGAELEPVLALGDRLRRLLWGLTH